MQSLIFFGADHYSSIVLATLLESSIYRPMFVVTDQQTGGSPVEQLAIAHNVKVAYYPHFDHTLITENTLGLCASFDHLIPAEIIKLFGGNLYNLHPSLLPQYRNVSPVQYAMALGDTVTGITLFRISPGIDDGAIIAQADEPILPEDTTATLTPRLFAKGADLFLEHLITLGVKGSPRSGSVNPLDAPLIFTKRLTRDSGYIEWPALRQLLQNGDIVINQSKNELLNLRLQKEAATNSHLTSSIYLLDLIRALHPWPGVWSLVPTSNGDLRISLVPAPNQVLSTTYYVQISSKPKPISYNDFVKYYLE